MKRRSTKHATGARQAEIDAGEACRILIDDLNRAFVTLH
jgi:hypothetical protein